MASELASTTPEAAPMVNEQHQPEARAAAPAAAAQKMKPKMSMRAMSTPINLLVCGASSSGKSSFINTCAKLLSPGDLDTDNTASSPVAALLVDDERLTETKQGPPAAVATALPPILVPEAGRELLYTFQDWPGSSSTLDPAGYLEALLTFLMQQQEKDYKQLHGSRGMHKSLACGCLARSITACIYFLPAGRPTPLDLVLLSGLRHHVAVIPMVGKADIMLEEEAAACCQALQAMLAEAEDLETGMAPIQLYRSRATICLWQSPTKTPS